MKAYFARSIDQYNTEPDKFCKEEIESLGFEVVDPNEFFTKKEYKEKGMEMFFERILECDVLFFKGLPDKRITAGVFKEIVKASFKGIPVYEIPHYINERVMSVEETRKYLKDKDVR